MPTFHQQPRQLDERIGGLGVLGVGLGEGVELASGLVQQVPAAGEVAGLRGLVQEHPAHLVVGREDQLGRGVGLLADLFEVVGRELVVTSFAQTLDELRRVPRVLVTPGGRRGGEPRPEPETDHHDAPRTRSAHHKRHPQDRSCPD